MDPLLKERLYQKHSNSLVGVDEKKIITRHDGKDLQHQSINTKRERERENSKTLELKVRQLKRELPLLRQKTNQGETKNFSFYRIYRIL